MTARPLHICPSTLLADPFELTPQQWEECLAACHRAGIVGISAWSLHLLLLENAGHDAAAVQAQLAEHNLEISCVEAIAGWANASSVDAALADARFTVDMAAAHGVSNIAAVLLGAELNDPEQAAENLAAIADLAADCDAWICLEYLPWSGIADIATAWNLVKRSDRPNVGFLFDSWHWHRQRGSDGPENCDVLRSIPGDRIRVFQLCDAEPEPSGGDPMEEAMTARPLPGRGVVNHRLLFEIFAETAAEPVICPEVFNGPLAAQGPGVAALAIADASRAVLELWPRA